MEHVGIFIYAPQVRPEQACSKSASVVAVVASIDEHFAQYPAALAMRRSKVEVFRLSSSHRVTI